MCPAHQVWPKPSWWWWWRSCKAQWKWEEDKADKRRGGKTSLVFAKSNTAVENREKCRKLVVKSSVVPRRPSRLSDWWWWWRWFQAWDTLLNSTDNSIIAKGWNHFGMARAFISLSSKIRLMHSLVTSIFLYACESWTLTAELQRRIQAMEMRCYRKMLRIFYKDHVTNEEVRAKIQKTIGPHECTLTIVKRCNCSGMDMPPFHQVWPKPSCKAQWKEDALVSWCFEPRQPQRITSGLNTNFNLSSSHSFQKSSYHKSCLFFFSLFLFRGLKAPTN